jgi:hypothetical protein
MALAEAATLLGVTTATLRQQIAAGKLKPSNVAATVCNPKKPTQRRGRMNAVRRLTLPARWSLPAPGERGFGTAQSITDHLTRRRPGQRDGHHHGRPCLPGRAGLAQSAMPAAAGFGSGHRRDERERSGREDP